MPISLLQLGNLVIDSIKGRKLGIDKEGHLVGHRGMRLPEVRGTSDTTGTDLPNYGFVSVVTTTDDTWRLSDPTQIGLVVTLMTGSSSTGQHSINLKNSVAYSTQGIASSTATLVGMGASLTLVSISTAIWQCIGRHGSTASAYLSS